MKASTDPDTMYYHQAMREPVKDKFKEESGKNVKIISENQTTN
jgi:hypothetical protein